MHEKTGRNPSLKVDIQICPIFQLSLGDQIKSEQHMKNSREALFQIP